MDTFSVSGGDGYVDHYTTKDFGHVDEDWLEGGLRKEALIAASGQGNHDRDAFYQDNANLFGDEKGGLEVCGQIQVKYGADGPGSSTLGLDRYAEQPEGTHLTFVNGDPDHSTFTQNGVPLVVLYSSETKLVVGTAVEVDGEGGTFFNETPVFCLELNPDTGKFDFHLLGAIDHDPTTAEPESDITLTFSVGSAEDFDHDKAIGAINIKVNDDSPETGVSYTSHADTSEDGDFSSTNFGYVDEDFLGDPPANTDNDNDPFAHEDADRGDTKGTNSCYGSIGTTNFGADGQGNAGSPFALAHLSGDFKDADGNLLKQNNQQLVVLDSTDGHLAVGLEGGSPVFELNLNGDGTFNFQLYGPLDQLPGTGTEPLENNLLLAFDAGNGATDGDGDPVTAVIKIQVNDDAPVAVEEKIDFQPPDEITGNIFDQAKKGADGARISHVNGVEIVEGGSHTFNGLDGSVMVIFADGSWNFTPGSDDNGRPADQTFTYTILDGDGDTATADLILNYTGDDGVSSRLAFVPTGPTHTVADSYDLSLTTYLSTDATKDKGYHPGDSVEINDTQPLRADDPRRGQPHAERRFRRRPHHG